MRNRITVDFHISGAAVIYAALTLTIFLSTGCATRGDVNHIITDINGLRRNYEGLEHKSAVADSLLREQLKLLRNLSTDVNYSLGQLEERMQLIEGKLEDLTTRQAERQYAISPPQTPMVMDSSGDSTKVKVEISAKQLYDTAYMDFIKGDFKIAVTGFREYVKNNPKTPLADNAQFFTGECYFNIKNYTKATNTYKKLLKDYSKSEKAPNAMVRLVEISLKRKDKKTADRYYKKLGDSFPGSPEAERATELLVEYNKKRKR